MQGELSKGDLLPERAAELLTMLSAILGNINDEILKRDMEYNVVLLHFLDTEEKANRAKIRAEISPEFQAKTEARNTKELVIEMIRSLKYMLRAKEEEYGVTKNY